MNNKSNRKRKYEKELSEVDYINGVKSLDGKTEVIRPLTKEESDYLAKFNNEFVGGNFKESNNIHDSLIKENSERVDSIKERLEAAKQAKKDFKKTFNKKWERSAKNDYNDKIAILDANIVSIKEELEKVDIMGQIWKDRYARRKDMYHNDVILVSDLYKDTTFKQESEYELFDRILSNSTT